MTSYLLVIYYPNSRSCNSGILTVLSNRVGDVGILLSIALLAGKGSWSYRLMGGLDKFALVGVIVAGITKRAQVPFSAWLPAAIAAPTPVSALVHSSTLVTAGVYLMIRFRLVLEGRGLIVVLVAAGRATIVISGVSANFEEDLKKLVALSTLSQLGLIIVIIGVGLRELAFFHLITHALFKSRLFMGAGFIIHSAGGRQDFRVARGFNLASPVIRFGLRVSRLALCGSPFLAGFYSKDLALESLLSRGLNIFLCLVSCIGVSLTIIYRIRLLYKRISRVRKVSSVRCLTDGGF